MTTFDHDPDDPLPCLAQEGRVYWPEPETYIERMDREANQPTPVRHPDPQSEGKEA